MIISNPIKTINSPQQLLGEIEVVGKGSNVFWISVKLPTNTSLLLYHILGWLMEETVTVSRCPGLLWSRADFQCWAQLAPSGSSARPALGKMMSESHLNIFLSSSSHSPDLESHCNFFPNLRRKSIRKLIVYCFFLPCFLTYLCPSLPPLLADVLEATQIMFSFIRYLLCATFTKHSLLVLAFTTSIV